MGTKSAKWWERKSNLLPYNGLLQGNEDACVYASIAGAVNHFVGREAWTPSSLRDECIRNGLMNPSFGVASIAVSPFSSEVEYVHHHTGDPKMAYSVEAIKDVLEEGGLVILSMELADTKRQRLSLFHMFTLIANRPDGFQVWDTNDRQGHFDEHDITNGVEYTHDTMFLPHVSEDTLIVKRK